MKQRLILLNLALMAALPALAQNSPPEIHPDRTVSFQLRAPNASNVVLTLESSATKTPMVKDDKGIWRATLGPLAPNVYAYSFWLDGLRVPDLGSSAIKPEPLPVSSMFEVMADQPQFFDFDPAVPHGTVRLHDYESKSLGQLRRMRVYTPPGYDQNARTKYPVLFLFHGGFDTEATWTEYGRANFTLDNLLAGKKAVPMIIVMLNGFATKNTGGTNATDYTGTRTAFEDDLLNDVIPFVEKNYRIKSGREHWAIAGMSTGGGQALTIGLTHLDQFAWIGGFSPSVAKRELVLAGATKNPKATNKQLKLLWFSCGKSDGLIQTSQQIDQALSGQGVEHTFVPMEGGHEWTVWRRALHDFLPLVFTDKK